MDSDLEMNNYHNYNDLERRVEPFQIQLRETIVEVSPKNKIVSELWQIVPSLLGSLLSVPFGIALGWASPSLLLLLEPDSPVPITMPLSPTIAASLLYGNVVGISFSGCSVLGTKLTMIFGLSLMIVGWTLIWQSINIFFLLGGRFLIGIGHGLASEKLKVYIRELCNPKLGTLLTKANNLFIILGVIVAFTFGIFLDFREFPLAAITVTIPILVICLLLPPTPQSSLRQGNVHLAKSMLHRVKPQCQSELEISQLSELANNPAPVTTCCQLVTSLPLLKNMTIVIVTMLFVQFTGGPGIIVYCQLMFQMLKVPYPQYCAIIYAIHFFGAYFITIKYYKRFCIKKLLIITFIMTILLLAANIILMYFNLPLMVLHYLSLLLMLFYIIVHAIDVATVPFALVAQLFPPDSRPTAIKVQSCFFFLFAIIVTKLFQVFYTAFDAYYVFVLFAGCTLVGVVFVVLFVPAKQIDDSAGK